MRHSWLPLFFLASLSIVGCGGSDSPDLNPGGIPSGSVRAYGTAFAEVRLGDTIPNVTVRYETLDGQQLAAGTSNFQGIVILRNLALPENFRVRASLPGSQAELLLEVRDYTRNERISRLTVLSTLQSLYSRKHPELTLEQADARLRRALRLPPTLDLAVSLFEPNPVFSDIAFLRAAAAGGGWATYCDRFLADIDSGKSRQYLLTVAELTTPLQGLDAALAPVAETARRKLARRAGYDNVNGARLHRPVAPIVSLVAGPGSLGGQFLLGVGTGVTGNLVGDTLSATFGWAANQMGLNYGTSGQLNEIQETLEIVLNIVENAVNQQTLSSINQQLNALNNQVIPVQSATHSLQTQAAATNVTDIPFTPPDSVSQLIQAIETPDYASILTTLQNGLAGSNSVTAAILSYNLTNLTGIDQAPDKYFFPWRNNHLIDISSGAFNYFATQQAMTLNLLSEEAHNAVINPDPVIGVNNAAPIFRQATQQLKRQRQQLPLSASSYAVLTDLENGCMWYQELQGNQNETDYQTALQFCANVTINMVFPDGSTTTYQDFRLPTYGECIALQNRARYNPTNDSTAPNQGTGNYPNIGTSLGGLQGLGFWFGNSGTDYGQINSDGNIWMLYGSINNGTTFTQDNWEFRFNHPEDSNIGNKNSNDHNPCLPVRTFGNQATQAIVTPYVTGQTSPVPASVQGRPLNDGECILYGAVTSISALRTVPAPANVTLPAFTTGGISVPEKVLTLPENAQLLQATLNCAVHLGGPFTLGAGVTQSFNNPINNSESGDATTALLDTGKPNNLQEWTIWESSDYSIADVLNLPGLDGIVIPHQQSPVTYTASAPGFDGNLVSASITVTPSAISPHTLQSLQISPRNKIYGASLAQPARGTYPIYCSGFYADKTMETLAGAVSWSITPAQNTANARVISTGPTTASLQLDQQGQANQTPFVLNITATSGSISDTMQVQVIPPDVNSSPRVSTLLPTQGAAAGGYGVILKGNHLDTTTQVTVAGVPVSFTINTAQEITINSMPAGTTNTDVNIIVSNPSGDALASFHYR